MTGSERDKELNTYLQHPTFIGPPMYPRKAIRKQMLTRAIVRTAAINVIQPENKLFLAVIIQAVSDIGTPYESKNCWDDGSLDIYSDHCGLTREGLKELVQDAGLYHGGH